MRKFLIPILMAGVMIPAAAMAQDNDRSDGRGERRAERAERAERVEKASSSDEPAHRPQRAERPQRVERVESVAREPRGDRRERRVEQVQPAEQVQPVQQVQQVERVRSSPIRQVQVRRSRDAAAGMVDVLREGARQQQALESSPTTRDGRRDGYRDGRRDGDRNQRWSNHWRGDNRYDWRRHRDRHRSIFRLGSYYDPYGWGYRRFSIGFNIGRGYYGSNYWLDDPWMYRLPPAYGPYRWVRYYDDALLVNIYSGQVVDVIHNFFW